jgi:hypothetical protein
MSCAAKRQRPAEFLMPFKAKQGSMAVGWAKMAKVCLLHHLISGTLQAAAESHVKR